MSMRREDGIRPDTGRVERVVEILTQLVAWAVPIPHVTEERCGQRGMMDREDETLARAVLSRGGDPREDRFEPVVLVVARDGTADKARPLARIRIEAHQIQERVLQPPVDTRLGAHLAKHGVSVRRHRGDAWAEVLLE